MVRVILCLLAAASLCSCSATKGPIGFWSEHRYDAELRPHGPWRQHYPGPPPQVSVRQRYRHGRAAGRWRFYAPDGTQERTEQYIKKGPIRITYFHANGNVLRKGQATVVQEPAGFHFFWFGEWPKYSADGQLLEIELYENGVLVGVKK